MPLNMDGMKTSNLTFLVDLADPCLIQINPACLKMRGTYDQLKIVLHS